MLVLLSIEEGFYTAFIYSNYTWDIHTSMRAKARLHTRFPPNFFRLYERKNIYTVTEQNQTNEKKEDKESNTLYSYKHVITKAIICL